MGFDNVTTLSGLFYISSTKDEKCGYLETVLSWKQFWGNVTTTTLQQPSFTPFSYNSNNVFEYLEVLFSVFLTIHQINNQNQSLQMFEMNDLTFYSHCKNNNMDLKLWEKKENSFKELLNIPIELHPFFETFSNPKIATQYHKEKVSKCSIYSSTSVLQQLLNFSHLDACDFSYRLDRC